jgi:hypothetical protein
MKNTFEYKGVYFSEGTPLKLADKLLELKESKERVVFDFGDPQTGKSWNEVYDISGRIGKSTGTKPILLLIHNSRSMGGGALMTDKVLTIKTSRGKTLIYKHG